MISLADRIELLLRDGKPRILRDICKELDKDYYEVSGAIRLLRISAIQRASIVGKWEQLATMLDVPMGSIRRDAGVYSHPGAPMLPAFIALPGGGKKRKYSSGVVTPPPYRTGFRWGGIPGAYF